MRHEGYRIADEPLPSGVAHLAVNPFWPFLAIMFGGAWLSWPWFVVNGFTVGSPTRRRELGVAVFGFVITGSLVVAILYAAGTGALSREALPYALLGLTVVKLAVTYWLHALQAATFEIYEIYGGAVRQGFLVILAAYFVSQSLGPKVLASAPVLYFWLH